MSNKTRVIFCTYSSIYSSIVLKQLIENESIDVVAIINSTRVLDPKFGHVRGAMEQIRRSGFRYSSYLFAVTDLFSLFQPFLHLKKGQLKTVHGLAAQYNIPLLDSPDVNQKTSLEFIARAAPKYLLAAHFNQLVKSALLDSTTIECINIHPSLLPSYKGVDPVFFAQLSNEKAFGVTVHEMAESFDTGEILSQDSFRFSSAETTLSINKKLFLAGADLAINWMSQSEVRTSKERGNIGANYDSWPTSHQVRQFKKAGKNLLNFSELTQ